MPVSVNGKFLAPAPTVTIGKNYIQNIGGVIGADYNITLNGTLTVYKGSAESLGYAVSEYSDSSVLGDYDVDNDPVNSTLVPKDFLTIITRKQERLRQLFTHNSSYAAAPSSGVELQIYGFRGDQGIRAQCFVDSIEFDDQSRWTHICGYTVNLRTNRFISEANGSAPNFHSSEDAFEYYISDAQNEWSISEGDQYTASTGNYADQQKIYTIGHNVSAVGQRTWDDGEISDPIAQASGYVHHVIGLGSGGLPGSFLNLPDTYVVYNRKISESINPFTGSYGVDEEFTLGPSGQAATETIEISVEGDLSALTRVQINGTINGFNTSGITDRVVNKYENAQAYWASVSGLIYDRANNYSTTCDLNTTALSTSIGRNVQEGVITYNYSFDNRPANFVSNALTEDIQVTDIYPGQNFSEIPIIGRSQPILQYVNSRTAYKRTMQINLQMPKTSCGSSDINGTPAFEKPSYDELTTIYNFYKPQGQYVYYSAPNENWNPKTGSYSYSIEWTYEKLIE